MQPELLLYTLQTALLQGDAKEGLSVAQHQMQGCEKQTRTTE